MGVGRRDHLHDPIGLPVNPRTLHFRKAHGAGNDFVVLDDRDDALLADGQLDDELVTALCDRRTGVGGDGVIRLGAPRDGGADVFMDYRNADGEAVQMCGNGVRVVADQWVRHVDPAARCVVVEARAGLRPVEVQRDADDTVTGYRVDMGAPILDPEAIPYRPLFRGSVVETLDLPRGQADVMAVGMGNPHAVLQVPRVDTAPVADVGPQLEHHPRFPERANVSFVAVLARDEVDLRVWERGVGETAACGTGACATVVALQRVGEVDERVAVHLPGGTLQIEHREGGTVWMTGPAVEVARGTVDLDALPIPSRPEHDAHSASASASVSAPVSIHPTDPPASKDPR